MTCAELRERAVDPASALQGGHATVLQHLETCPDCRMAMRSFGAIDRLFRTPAPLESPADLDRRARALYATPRPGIGRLLKSPVAIAILVGTFLVVALQLTRRAPTSGGNPPASPAARRTALPGTPVPAIVAVESTPIVVNAVPLTRAEEREALRLYDFDFLMWRETLAGLGPFFPAAIGPAMPGAAAGGSPRAGPPLTPEDTVGRLQEWLRMPKAQRARVVAANQEFRERPEAERALLEERWSTVAALSEDERAGLRRLAARLTELDAKSVRRLESDVRTIGLAPRAERPGRWRALPFAQGLTGQELASAEKLLLSR